MKRVVTLALALFVSAGATQAVAVAPPRHCGIVGANGHRYCVPSHPYGSIHHQVVAPVVSTQN